MDSHFLIHLTFALYKVVNLLPDRVLAEKIKRIADQVLADCILVLGNSASQGILARAIKSAGSLKAYFAYAKRMNWINPENFSILEREYAKIEDFLRNVHMVSVKPALFESKSGLERLKPDLVQKQGQELSSRQTSLTTRQARILEILRNKEKVQVWELQKVFPEVTKRTLRRDLDALLHCNAITRGGEWNQVFYQLASGE